MSLDNECRLLQSVKALLGDVPGSIERLLGNQELVRLTRSYEENKEKRLVNVGLNLFVLISDIYHRENFHSDILRVFLDPASPHREGNKYLDLFLDFLHQQNPKLNINKSDFQNAAVVREENRIDLLIRDATSKKAIIVENKMYNAGDMYRQIPRYLNKVKDAGYECEAIVYLRLNRIQYPDTTDWRLKEQEEVDSKLICVTAYMDATNDLLNGWIYKCEKASDHVDALLILRQYGTLIQKLGGEVMNKPIMDEFYKMMLVGDNLKTAQSVSSMLGDLILYRVQMLIEKFGGNLEPFKRIKNYDDYVAYFEGLSWNQANVGLDMIVLANSYAVQVWDRSDPQRSQGRAELLLQSLGCFDEFTLYNERYIKNFVFPTQEQEMIEYVTNFKKNLVTLTKSKNP